MRCPPAGLGRKWPAAEPGGLTDLAEGTEEGQNARTRYIGVRRMQAQELHHYQEPEDYDRAPGEGEVLPFLPQAHHAQRDQVTFGFAYVG